MSKVIALIPARFAATRFPGKLMKLLQGKTIIRRTYEAVLESALFDEVIVVCDDAIIFNEIESFGGKAVMSAKAHESGTDRIAEIAATSDADIIVNIQGDEPFISHEALEKVLGLFQNEEVLIGSLMLEIHDLEKINNPNCVKVVVDQFGKALYFSRAPIPFYRDETTDRKAFQHIGVYAFRRDILVKISNLPTSELERIEKLENLRMLENGIPIHLAQITHVGISIDTLEDFERAEQYLREKLV
jgi:3-deoxy-manno-octulosonate cytidylyltransferase (CMP-KDO synthetase)